MAETKAVVAGSSPPQPHYLEIGATILTVAFLAISIATRVTDFLNVGQETADFMVLGSALLTTCSLLAGLNQVVKDDQSFRSLACLVIGVVLIALNVGLFYHTLQEDFFLFGLGALFLAGSCGFYNKDQLKPYENKLLALAAIVAAALLAVGISSKVVDYCEMGENMADQITALGAIYATVTLTSLLRKQCKFHSDVSTVGLFALIYGIALIAIGIGFYYPNLDETYSILLMTTGAASLLAGAAFVADAPSAPLPPPVSYKFTRIETQGERVSAVFTNQNKEEKVVHLSHQSAHGLGPNQMHFRYSEDEKACKKIVLTILVGETFQHCYLVTSMSSNLALEQFGAYAEAQKFYALFNRFAAGEFTQSTL